MNQDPKRVAEAYNRVAGEYAEKFRDEHDHKPLDREMLGRFAKSVSGEKPFWYFVTDHGVRWVLVLIDES